MTGSWPPLHGLGIGWSSTSRAPGARFTNVSCRCTVRSLLEKNPEARLTVGEALAHPWLAQDAGAPSPLLSSVVVERLRSFTRTSRLERLLLNVAANQLTNKEIDRLADIFRALDFDGDGCVILIGLSLHSHRQHSMARAGIMPAHISFHILLHIRVDRHIHGPVRIMHLSVAPGARRRLSAEDLRHGLGAVGSQMDSEAVKKLANELDISGCGSLNLEVSLNPRHPWRSLPHQHMLCAYIFPMLRHEAGATRPAVGLTLCCACAGVHHSCHGPQARADVRDIDARVQRVGRR